MNSNFNFLDKYWPKLSKIGETAETYLYSDPNSCAYKIGLFAESLIIEIYNIENIKVNVTTHSERLKYLKREGLLPFNINEMFHALRLKRNNAVHNNVEINEDDALTMLKMAYNIASWFMEVYGDWDYLKVPFVVPQRLEKIDYKEKLKKQEEEIKKLSKKNVQIKTKESNKSQKERIIQSNQVSDNIELSESETRFIIDEQLRRVGWEADTYNIRYSKGIRPQKGRNLAIAEWPTDSNVGKNGYVDYALFVGLDFMGIIEAKKSNIDVSSVIDYQCKEYASHIKKEHKKYCLNQWSGYSVPFVFSTNGRKYLKQIEIKSGIWFLDLRQSYNVSKALKGWVSPKGIQELYEKNIKKGDYQLDNMPYDFLRDSDGLNLRPYQIKAIEKTEEAIKNGKQQILLSMATGTGKTRTILGMIYRLVKSKRFKRVLFLVDRTSLGIQAIDVFNEVKIEDLMTLDSIYNIKGLDDKTIDKETKIQIATVQSMIKRVLMNDDGDMPSVTDFDLIIVDEAHRGYILDKEMSDDELLYRNQDEYTSKYRSVIEYFDAVKIGLTATPAIHTVEIFGAPVFNYSYREAVIDGYLVDHDAPHELRTKLNSEGIKYKKGEVLPLYDNMTGEIVNSEQLNDDIDFDIDTFNKQVITEKFNKTVLNEIANNINPEGDGKTLIYAVDDNHADMIVKLLKEIYSSYEIDNDAIMKITGSVAGGNKKKIEEAIKRFKNERYPNIVVTVDLLTTGIDVPKITNLVFMRRVKSRILFEQMLGRATRLCPEINKTHFEIYDPVRIYEDLEKVSTMKPILANPYTTFEDLINSFVYANTEEKKKCQMDLFIAKLQRKNKNMSKETIEHFINLTSKNPKDYAMFLREVSVINGIKAIVNDEKAFLFLDEEKTRKKNYKVVDQHEDELLEHYRGYGVGQKPEDYIEAFKQFITENMDEIEALKLVCTKPSELTREDLKKLRVELDNNNFTEQQLNTAWNDLTNQEIVIDIIGFIRNQALKSNLITHEQRVKQAVQKLKNKHQFNKIQLDWLKRIEKAMLTDLVLDKDVFETGAFKSAGGYKKVDKYFSGNLLSYISELSSYMYDDGGLLT